MPTIDEYGLQYAGSSTSDVTSTRRGLVQQSSVESNTSGFSESVSTSSESGISRPARLPDELANRQANEEQERLIDPVETPPAGGDDEHNASGDSTSSGPNPTESGDGNENQQPDESNADTSQSSPARGPGNVDPLQQEAPQVANQESFGSQIIAVILVVVTIFVAIFGLSFSIVRHSVSVSLESIQNLARVSLSAGPIRMPVINNPNP